MGRVTCTATHTFFILYITLIAINLLEGVLQADLRPKMKRLIYVTMLLATLSCSKDNDEPEVPIEIPEEVPEVEDPQLKSLTFLSYDNPMQ